MIFSLNSSKIIILSLKNLIFGSETKNFIWYVLHYSCCLIFNLMKSKDFNFMSSSSKFYTYIQSLKLFQCFCWFSRYVYVVLLEEKCWFAWKKELYLDTGSRFELYELKFDLVIFLTQIQSLSQSYYVQMNLYVLLLKKSPFCRGWIQDLNFIGSSSRFYCLPFELLGSKSIILYLVGFLL